MDKELNEFFEDFDLSGEEDEEIYRKQARQVHESFEEKLDRVGGKLRFAQDLVALFRYFMDPRVAWQRKTIVVAALLYFIMPIDAVPDLAPFVGYLDDFGVIMAVTKFMSGELAPYYGAETPAEFVDRVPRPAAH
ncbi:MAG: YkvA family protein [Bacteroidota bacterium]|nr:YkvA family protein [Bacteroidota bacterium]